MLTSLLLIHSVAFSAAFIDREALESGAVLSECCCWSFWPRASEREMAASACKWPSVTLLM